MNFLRIGLVLLSCFFTNSFALNCPKPSDFNQHLVFPPTSYDSKTQQIKQNAIVIDKDGQWLMVLHPLLSTPGENNEHLVNDILNQLVEVSATSFKSSLVEGETPLDYCIYTNPQLPNLSAFAYYIGHISPQIINGAAILKNPNLNQFIQSIAILK